MLEDRALLRTLLEKSAQLGSTNRHGQAIARVFHSYNADQGLIKLVLLRAVEVAGMHTHTYARETTHN
ncbi:MAG: hypothetical protein H0V43_01840 [Gemmatimonadales bacterium]|nr:hypothetical protein [Gemmatimonadales bacterium]